MHACAYINCSCMLKHKVFFPVHRRQISKTAGTKEMPLPSLQDETDDAVVTEYLNVLI